MSLKAGSRLVGVEVLREKGMDLEYVLQVELEEFSSGLMGDVRGLTSAGLLRCTLWYFPHLQIVFSATRDLFLQK